MGPEYWKPGVPTALKKCSERISNSCSDETDGCCGVVACTYCLEWHPEEGEIQYGVGEDFGTYWSGSIAGATWVGRWERNYETDECEFVVTLDDEEIYRKSCDDGQSCRDSSDEASAEIGYEAGTVHWIKFLSRPLQYRDDEETFCKVHFCDDCECSCEELCVAVSEVLPYGYGYDDFTDTYDGEIANTAEPCDPPVWEGTVGSFDLSLALGHDEYGNCIITPAVNDIEREPVLAPGCSEMQAVIELEDGSTIRVRCKKCHCPSTIGDCICSRPLGPVLTLLWSSANGTHGNAPREFDLTYGTVNEPQITCSPYPTGIFPAYTGSSTGTFPIPMGGTRQDTLYVMLVCCIGCPDCVYYRYQSNMNVGDNTWYLTHILEQDCDCPAILSVDNFQVAIDYQISDITIFEKESNC